ncbi:hypothetical protein TrVE_jg6944 [Triparma verrucosa]|uniref:transketolase n=1 Tax=Triparma verrucosa TaxID=1606542 RepID=A0A9W7BIE0_9STRA|nr:hypothetical protein TrVE_jg6944 [Triparma verrucosa]
MSSPDYKKRKSSGDKALDNKCIDTIRVFSADMVQAANSGHPGAPMGCAPMAHLLWSENMTFSPSSPEWSNRDRFVLSNGHACALQYSMLHLTGYDVTLDDCKKFRQLGSKTPGHPENFCTDGVEVCTGPLGQGLTNAVGMAMAEKHLAATFNQPDFPVVDHFTYVICGDGCLQEGVTSEASSLAGHLGLGKLIVLYDDNNITIDGSTELSFTEDVSMRYESYGWHVQAVTDLTNLDSLRNAISKAREVTDKPSMIKVKTVIGLGSKKEGTHGVHGAPLGAEDLSHVKSKYGFNPEESFAVPSDVAAHYASVSKQVEADKSSWDAMFAKYQAAHPALHAEFVRRENRELPAGLLDLLPVFKAGDKDLASRKLSEACINSIAENFPELMGGSADLTPSNLTSLKCSSDFQASTPAGRYIRFGVREHAMAGICNGMFAHGNIRPYCATFLNFAGYALGSIRCSALSKFGVLYVMTHDSIGLGEDGPTHQPIEMIESLRSMPNVNVLRPCDTNETNAAYQIALTQHETPSVICLSRQTLPNLAGTDPAKAQKGGYIVSGGDNTDLVLVGTGSETGLCAKAAEELASAGIKARVVSMMCMDVFDAQSEDYKKSVLGEGLPVIAVEAAAVGSWNKYSHVQVCMKTFGASGKGGDLMSKFGFTLDNVVAKSKLVVDYYKSKGSAPDLFSRPVWDDVVSGH